MKENSRLNFLVVAVILFMSLKSHHLELQASNATPVLTIYSSSSFVSNWGPGPTLKRNFELTCQCILKFIPVADGPAILTRLKLESKSSQADLVLGIDAMLASEAEKLDIFEDTGISILNSALPNAIKPSTLFVPYDFGYYAFMFDTKFKHKKTGLPYSRPKNMKDLLTSKEYERSIIVQDPRTSTAGMGLVLWLRSIYPSDFSLMLKQLSKQTLVTSKSWSDSYSLFTKGEAPIVLSYTTSEAYHRSVDKTDRYQALSFDEGHYLTVETVALLKTSRHQELARNFIKFLLESKSQGVIASANWMYPVSNLNSGLPPSYVDLMKPKNGLWMNESEVATKRIQWIKVWVDQNSH